MEEQQLPSVSGKKRGKHIVIAAVSLIVIAIIAATIVLWPEKESVTPTNDTVVGEELSPEELMARALESIHEYDADFPEAASLAVSAPELPSATCFDVKDANGASIGFALVDGYGNVTSMLRFDGRYSSSPLNVTLEQAADIAVEYIAGKGIDPEMLLLDEAYIAYPVQDVIEYHLMYHPHIGDVPVYYQDSCSIWVSPVDGSIMFFGLHGSFVLPDTTPTETLVTKEEAATLALDDYKKSMEEVGGSKENIDIVVVEPVRPIYVQMTDSITPFWEIKVAANDGMGMRLYHVNATTGEMLPPDLFN